MNEPWFNPLFAWVPGVMLGCLAGLWGALVGTLGPQGKARSLVIGLYWVLLAGSAGALALGIAALLAGQPYAIWYGLGLTGVIGVVVLGANGPMVFRVYRAAEQRRLEAHDLK
jgi:multidrug transporter EmrE-like cation transporter